jgi:hypothetical protein
VAEIADGLRHAVLRRAENLQPTAYPGELKDFLFCTKASRRTNTQLIGMCPRDIHARAAIVTFSRLFVRFGGHTQAVGLTRRSKTSTSFKTPSLDPFHLEEAMNDTGGVHTV